MFQSLGALRATWRIVKAKPRQIWRLTVPPFLLAMALNAWLSVGQTGDVRPDLPRGAPIAYDLIERGSLALALAVMALLWHRAIYFGPRAPLSPWLTLGYWGRGAVLGLIAGLPFVLPAALMFSPFAAGLGISVFLADAVSLWLILCLGKVVASAAGGRPVSWGTAWRGADPVASAVLAIVFAAALYLQGLAVAILERLHGGAAFLLDATISFVLIVAVLTLMTRPET